MQVICSNFKVLMACVIAILFRSEAVQMQDTWLLFGN